MKKTFQILLLLLSSLPTYSQLEADNWVVCAGCPSYLNFQKATQPIAVPFPPNTMTGQLQVSYSDKNGQLLFSSNGFQLFNRNFKISPLTISGSTNPGQGGLNNYAFDSPQKVLAVPYPGKDSLFILFHVYVNFYEDYHPKLYYSIINMNLDSGRGDIKTTERNFPLFGTATNAADIMVKLTAVQHCNKKDYWVVGHYANSNDYFSLLVTENGVNPIPVISTGQFVSCIFEPNPTLNTTASGCAKISPIGDKIAAAFPGQGNIELGDFNSQTGSITNIKQIKIIPPADTIYDATYNKAYGPIGLEFSPTGSRLYVTSNYDFIADLLPRNTSFLYQYNISLPTVAAIENSFYFVDTVSYQPSSALQLANNGKVYMGGGAASEIANPEVLGAGCGYTFRSVNIGFGLGTRALPQYVQSTFKYPVIATGNCQFQNIDFSLQNLVGVASVSWNFGDPTSGVNNTSTSFTPQHIFTSQGIFKVRVVVQNTIGCAPDTLIKFVNTGPFRVFLGNDTTICIGDTLRLKANVPNASNLWNDFSADTSLVVTRSGTYFVKVSLGDCTALDTIVVNVRPLPVFTLGKDTVICNNAALTLSASPAFTNASHLWSTAATSPTITVADAGSYWLKLRDSHGCKSADTIIVSKKTLPNYSLGRDTSFCAGDSIRLEASVTGSSSYSWSNGATSATIFAKTAGIYWCDVNKEGCVYRDSIVIAIKPLPVVNLGKDTIMCEDKTLLLNASNISASYLWQDNSINSSFNVNKAGIYNVKVNLQGCSSSDSIRVDYKLRPRFTLGASQTLCLGQSITLAPILNNDWQLSWQDGSTEKTFLVQQTGIFSVRATNNCGETRSDVSITDGICKIFVPTAFAPSGKNKLLRVLGTELISSFDFKVYNRYGQLVYSTNDKNKGWDGKFNGAEQPQGNYIWLLKYSTTTDSKTQVLRGSALLLR